MRASTPPIFDAFGNLVSGGGDPDLFSPPVFMDTGYQAPGGVPAIPDLSDFNYLFYHTTNALRYFSQRGLKDWDSSETDYGQNDFVRFSGDIWKCTGTPTTGTSPTSDLANWQRWVKSPVSQSEGEEITLWRDGLGIRRTEVDSWGFLDGHVVQWDEAWQDINAFTGSLPSYSTQRWAIHGDTHAVVQSRAPQWTLGNKSFRFLQLGLAGAGAGERVEAMLLPQYATAVFTDDVVIKLAWKFMVNALSGVAGLTFVMGFTANSEPSSSINDGAYISKAPTDLNWQGVSTAAGAPLGGDTGVLGSPNVLRRATLVLIGKNVSRNNTAKALFYVDGTGIQLTSSLPYTTGGAGAGLPIQPIFGMVAGGGAATADLLIGPVRYRQITDPLDNFGP